ncbi:MAG: FAD:protein FMN transferase, partial [Candidatus Methylomirabilales bacterium]
MMAQQPLSILDRLIINRRRFLTTLAGSFGWMLCGFPPQVMARGMSGMRSLILGRLLMGTVVESEANHPDLKIARQAVEAGFNRMAEVDRLMSIFRPDSEISRVNRLAAKRRIQVG